MRFILYLCHNNTYTECQRDDEPVELAHPPAEAKVARLTMLWKKHLPTNYSCSQIVSVQATTSISHNHSASQFSFLPRTIQFRNGTSSRQRQQQPTLSTPLCHFCEPAEETPGFVFSDLPHVGQHMTMTGICATFMSASITYKCGRFRSK